MVTIAGIDTTLPSPRRVRPVAAIAAAWIVAVGVYPGLLWAAVWGFSDSTDAPLAWAGVACLVLPAVLLPRSPVAAVALMLLGVAAMTVEQESPDSWYAQVLMVDVAVGVVAAFHPRRLSIPVAVAALVVQLWAAVLVADDTVAAVGFAVLAAAAAWLIGDLVQQRRAHTAQLRHREVEQAAVAERLRIARDVHDMIAHSIGVIAIQAGVGSRVMDTQPAEARKALDTIESTSRQTLAQLRHVVGGLRGAEAQAPGLDELDALIAATADAGLDACLERRGRPRDVPADVGLAAYRIIQESLTNVARHAAASRCQVTVDYGDGELLIVIADDGRGGDVATTGHGIAGMRERAALLGGGLVAAPRSTGGFEVTARLPIPEATG